jgi:cysteine desulfurase family protein
MIGFMRRDAANPGRGAHRMAVRAARTIADARACVAKLIGARSPDRLVFTLNATDAINLALKGVLSPGDHVVTSCLEHNAVVRPLEALRARGVDHTRVPCGADGLVEPEAVAAAIRPATKLVVLAHASNVVGTIQPVREIGRVARERGLLVLVDAAQTAGAVPIDVEADSIDLLAFPGHKALLGPAGTGGLYVGERARVEPLREGGTGTRSESEEQPTELPEALESGTPNGAGIAGLGAAVEYVMQRGVEAVRAHEVALTARLLEGLRAIDGVTVYGGAEACRRTAVVAFNVAGWGCHQLAAALDDSFGIAARAGLHCAPAAHRTIGTFPEGSVRLSPGIFTTADEVEAAIEAVGRLAGSSW